ncbi:hypothetical protein GCM10027610_079530 [Dactylosporangium cerinum]
MKLSYPWPNLPRMTETITTLPTLSPSRAADFKTCPLLYRFRSIDRLPERPTPDQMRGTLVHAVLEALFEEPTGTRTPERAAALVAPQWQRLVETEEGLADLFADTEAFLESSRELLGGYFAVEDPNRLEPAERRRSSRPRSTASSSSVATSTGSTSPPPATSGSWTTRPAARPARRSRRGPCSS